MFSCQLVLNHNNLGCSKRIVVTGALKVQLLVILQYKQVKNTRVSSLQDAVLVTALLLYKLLHA